MSEYKSLESIIDTKKGLTAYACAMGPSLKQYIQVVEANINNNVIVTCSDFHTMTKIKSDYWVFANSMNTVPRMKDVINQLPETKLVYADSVDPTPRENVIQILEKDFIGYDQRHFNNQKCNECPNGCLNQIDGRRTIQELLMDYTGYEQMYGPGDTVALHVLALSVLLGCKKIYLFGVDLDYSLGYVDDRTINHDSFNPYLNNIVKDFDIINKSAKKIGVEIYNMSEVSPLKSVLQTKNSMT